MGAMKRLVGWKASGWPIPQPLQAFAGLVPYRPTAEQLADRKAAEREAKAEREAIQAEARAADLPTAIIPDPARNIPRATPAIPGPRPEIAEPVETTLAIGQGLPTAAAPGWYRFGQTFYRVGSGPFENFGITPTVERPAVRPVQLTLF